MLLCFCDYLVKAITLKKQEFIKIADKYARGNASTKEENLVSSFFDSLQDKDLATSSDEIRREKIFNAIKAKTVYKYKKRSYLKIAAVAILFISIGTLLIQNTFNNSIVEYTTLKGERKTILLPDSSYIFLNSESTIAYAKNFTTNRNIKLYGEAFFKVKKDSLHPFTVKTNTIKTTVLGTSFNINSYYKNAATISVNTGKVKVQMIKDTSQQLFLTKNQSATYTHGKIAVEKDSINAKNCSAWTNNTLWFNNLSLKEVSRKLENWFDVEIEIKDKYLNTLKLTGTYKNPKLSEVLESIKFLKGIEYTIKDNQISIQKPINHKKPM